MTLNSSNEGKKSVVSNARRVEGHRLVYYRVEADAAFWDAHWKPYVSPQVYEGAEHGYLGEYEEIFAAYLPKEGRILEAGCGIGKLVLSLRVRGYDIEGVEWGAETVQAVRSHYPDLPIRVADVTKLDVPDSFYSGYISLGVVEHREQGPEPFLDEANRVLERGGVALISVPFFHPLRQFKGQMGFYRCRINGLKFYAYAFTKAEFSNLLRNAGFNIIECVAYDLFKGIGDEIPLMCRIFKMRGIGWRLNLWLKSSQLGKNLGHMALFVCQKE
jgi:SAM-dependent methyltransferase